MPFISSFSNTGRGKATFPGQAATPSISSQASGQVAIAWSAPSFSGGAPITDYKIEYTSNGGSTWTEWSHAPSTATSATITGLADYLTYNFRVTAKNAVGLGVASANSAGASQFNAATGGTESTVSNYNGTGQTWKVHTFTSSSTLNLSRSIVQNKILCVAGGGGASGNYGSGGGAGGMLESNYTMSSGSYTVTVGGGGAGAGGGVASNGGSSSVSGVISTSGGGGGSGQGGNGANGGSGGGTSRSAENGGTVAGSGIAGQGNAGRAQSDSNNRTGDGGGASAGFGGTGAEYGGGNPRSSNITGASVYYSRGGSGTTYGQTIATTASGYGGGGHAEGASGRQGIVVVAYRIA